MPPRKIMRSRIGGAGRAQPWKGGEIIFSHNSTTTYFNAVPPHTHNKIHELDSKVGGERQSLSDSELLNNMSA